MLRHRRNPEVLLAIGALCLAACSGDDAQAGDGKANAPVAAPAEPDFGEAPAAVPADQPGVADDNLRAHLNLMNLAHLADVDRGGLFIDFGTPARDKYTVGNWKSGFGKDAKDGDTTYTNVPSVTGRVYLPLDLPGDGPLTASFRLKAIGTGTMQLYLNNEALPVVKLQKGSGFGVYDVEVPRALVKPGENYLLMRLGDTVTVGGEKISVAVDYLHIKQGAAPAAAGAKPAAAPANLPRYGTLVQELAVGGTKRRAIVAAAPTRMSFHVDVPSKASLSFRVGLEKAAPDGAPPSKVRVEVTPVGGERSELFAAAPTTEWQQQVLSLEAHAGSLVRLDFVSEGGGTVGWASPAVMVPKVELPKPAQARNTVVLLIDTLRASKLRTYNKGSAVVTPVLDAFAKEGTVFEAAQSPENWTKPSVASVLTGLYPLTHGTKKTESKLPESATMISEVYKKAGHRTATFLANGYVSDKFGFKQGWDYYTNYIRESKSTVAENVFRDSAAWIEKNKDERFFVYIQTIDPHVPYDVPKEFLDMYDAREYGGIVKPRMTPDLLEKAKRNPPKVKFTARDRERLEALHNAEISYHDKYMGIFIDKMKELGLYDDMMFVVVSDHGEEFYEHGSFGHGHSVYQEMIHVPMIFRRPGIVPAGKRVPETVGTLDIMPTVLTASGLPIPKDVEGRNRLDHLRGDVPAGPAVAFSDFLDDRHVIRAGRWKLVLRGHNITLFDLEKDPGEQHPLKHRMFPIAMRYCRIHLGQFLGAEDRRNWLSADQDKGADLGTQDTNIDEQTKEQLKQLGYIVDDG